MNESDKKYMQMAIDNAINGTNNNEGGPFGCVIVKNGEIVGQGNNRVTSTNDPTAHAEVVAIRDACTHLKSFQLDECIVYTSCEPCPMCLGALYWARPTKIFYACTKKDAADIDFDDDFIYKEIELAPKDRQIPTVQISRKEGLKAFENWTDKMDKTAY